jgi:hypothetical protein
MSSGSCLTSKLYDKFIKMLSKYHETIPLIYSEKSTYRTYVDSEISDLSFTMAKIRNFSVHIHLKLPSLYIEGSQSKLKSLNYRYRN